MNLMRYADYSLVQTVLVDIEAGRHRSPAELHAAREALERMIQNDRQSAPAALMEQADEVRSALEVLLQANPDDDVDPSVGRDNRRLIRMCIQRLERGLRGEAGTDVLRTAADWIGEP